jgi:serine/threonine protein kinase
VGEGIIGDRYRIARRLGVGGMSRVYLCWDVRLQLWCAIKVMVAEAVGESVLRARFVQEARSLARLGHPHLVRLYDLVDHVESPFMVMEYVEGGTVAARLARGEVALRDAVRLAAEACSGLHAAHEAGIVHRDIKPQNLLLDAHGNLKVSDFGVARVEQEMRLTMSNMSLGTVAYMPPEQQRDAAKVDHRADIYGVGATLYAMVTGRRPTALLTGDRTRTLGELPLEVRSILERATQAAREQRYPTARAMEEALREVLERLPSRPDDPELVDEVAPPPSQPPTEEQTVELEPGELDGTERSWIGVAVGAPSRSMAPTEVGRPASRADSGVKTRPTFREIDPSADSLPSQTISLPTPARPSVLRRVAIGLLALTGGLLCGGACAGVLGMGGIGAIFAIGQ